MEAELRQHPKGLRAKLTDHCVIGRSQEADIRVFSSRVSREHVMIRRQSTGFWIYDLRSANGTQVNGRDIDQPTLLEHGDVIQIADITLHFHVLGMSDTVAMEVEVPATVIGVKKTPVTLLVADIVNFTGQAERLEEEQLATALNAWYEDCQRIMAQLDGTIDKFMGDGLLAYWKDTTPQARANAVEAARLLVRGPEQHSPEVQEILDTHQIHFRCGVGLHIGDAAVGAVTRGMRTALGDSVNVVFRIEAHTRVLETPVLASAAFLENWPEGSAAFQSHGLCELKGQSTPIELFSLNTI